MGALKSVVKLDNLCNQFRRELIQSLYLSQSGHPGSSLSVCEILTTLYYNILNVDPKNPNWENRDRLVLSKGHAAPMLYIIMAQKGFFPKKELKFVRQVGHMLQGHPSRKHIPGIDYTAGPLGLGISFGAGVAVSAKYQKKKFHTFVVVGDGELQEGCVWEGLMSAAKFKLDNLTIILDNNGVQLDGTNDEVMPLGDLEDKFTSFGCNVIIADGHNIDELTEAMLEAKHHKGQPTVIIAKTVKGKGISFMEGRSRWHSAAITDDAYNNAMKELGGLVYD